MIFFGENWMKMDQFRNAELKGWTYRGWKLKSWISGTWVHLYVFLCHPHWMRGQSQFLLANISACAHEPPIFTQRWNLQNTLKKTIRNGNKVTECAVSAVPILAGYHEASENAGGSEIPWGLGEATTPALWLWWWISGGTYNTHLLLGNNRKKFKLATVHPCIRNQIATIDGFFNFYAGRFCGLVLESDLKPGKGTSSRIY